MLLIFFIDMSLNILSFFIKFVIALFANFGSGCMSDIHLKSVQHRVQSQSSAKSLSKASMATDGNLVDDNDLDDLVLAFAPPDIVTLDTFYIMHFALSI
jgi:hypothetical protein